MKSAVMAIACAAGAQAFVTPSAFNGAALTTSAKPSSAMKMAFQSEIGAQAPLGFWDPLGLVKDESQERFDSLRYVEIKHGRVAMLAVLGHLTAQNVRLPGLLSYTDNVSFSDMPNGIAALSKMPNGVFQIVAFIGFLELFVMKQAEGSFPGDMTYGGVNPFGKAWAKMSPEKQRKKRAIELNNGRAAQMGILGLMVHEELSNTPYIINEILGAHVNFN